ncbi:MAG: hypothetical protein L0323_10510, partial [Planctomycetes bacterium]|nr:hypothetical protein [Planctomycetota bacterium]
MESDESGRVPTDLAPLERAWRADYPPRTEFALSALLRGATVTDAAEAAGICRQTLSEWLHRDPEFAREYAERRREMFEGVRRGLEARVAEAVRTLGGLLRDDDPHVRVAACKVLVGV